MTTTQAATGIPWRLLLGSGPSPVPERVLQALAQPTIGHMDPAFAEIMGETIGLLREAFQTENQATLPISGTGSAGMEAMVANFVDPGDRVVCGVNGLFGERMAVARSMSQSANHAFFGRSGPCRYVPMTEPRRTPSRPEVPVLP